MSQLPAAQTSKLESWAELAFSQGWLTEQASNTLQSASQANPGQLFDQAERPLVAGLFGGTGVGKSTLLNRLAGEPIARASAERPTSRDITVYVHRSVSVDHLPDSFPMQRMRTALHNSDTYRQIMFIDMPDFDSVEESNRELVDIWLPHLDVVMYVVSPERYRDDKGWQLLTRHVKEHAWLFVINQWDRGNPVQRDDFIAQLAQQGLTDPMVFCTDCANPAHAAGADMAKATDDLPALQDTLVALSDKQIVSQLQEQGVLARLQHLKSLSDAWLEPLGDDSTFTQLTNQWQVRCEQHRSELLDPLQWPIHQVSLSHVNETPFWQRLLGRKRTRTHTDAATLETLAQTLNDRLDTRLAQFINQQAHEQRLPLTAIRQAVYDSHQAILDNTHQALQDSLNNSLLNPGNAWQRKLHKTMGILCLLLPLAALGWISFRVVVAFSEGGSNPAAYLGSSFAVNGALLIGLSWLLPALAHTRLEPAREQAARSGLEQGAQLLIAQCDEQVSQSLVHLSEQAGQLRRHYQALWAEVPGDRGEKLPASVSRLLSTELSQERLRVLDVRANTHNSTDAAPQS